MSDDEPGHSRREHDRRAGFRETRAELVSESFRDVRMLRHERGLQEDVGVPSAGKLEVAVQDAAVTLEQVVQLALVQTRAPL